MNKETFVNLLNAVIEYYRRENKFAKFYNEMYGEYPVDRADGLLDTIVDILDDFAGNDEIVGWWLFDAPDGISGEPVKMGVLRDADGNDIDVSTPEKLYEYVMQSKNSE